MIYVIKTKQLLKIVLTTHRSFRVFSFNITEIVHLSVSIIFVLAYIVA